MQDEFTARWLPSSGLRRWMLWGALAAAVAVVLSACGVAAELTQNPDVAGLPLSDLLGAMVVLPEVVVLLALVVAAREIRALGLWRSAIGYFGTLWLFTPLLFTSEGEDMGRDLILGMVLIGGMIGLLVVVCQRPGIFAKTERPASRTTRDEAFTPFPAAANQISEPQPEAAMTVKASKTPHPPKKAEAPKNAWGCGATLAVLTLLRLVSRALRNVNIDWPTIVPIAGVALLAVCAVGFTIWFGLSKIRARDTLGSMAAVSGAADLVFLLGLLTAGVYVAVTLLPLAMDGVEINDGDPRIAIPLTAISLLDIAAKLMLGLMFLSVWRREPDPWDVAYRPWGQQE